MYYISIFNLSVSSFALGMSGKYRRPTVKNSSTLRLSGRMHSQHHSEVTICCRQPVSQTEYTTNVDIMIGCGRLPA